VVDFPPIRVALPSVDTVLDKDASSPYPHAGPMLAEGIAEHLENEARARDREPTLTLEFSFEGPPAASGAEAEVRDAVHRYFATEAGRADLDLRVNQREGWISMRILIPLAVAFGIPAGLVYYFAPDYIHGFAGLVLAAGTLGTAVIVAWIWVWDPIEKLTFNPVSLKARVNALRKLSAARIEFSYRSAATPTT